MSDQTALEYLIKLNADGAISSVKEFQQALDNAQKMVGSASNTISNHAGIVQEASKKLLNMAAAYASVAFAKRLITYAFEENQKEAHYRSRRHIALCYVAIDIYAWKRNSVSTKINT